MIASASAMLVLGLALAEPTVGVTPMVIEGDANDSRRRVLEEGFAAGLERGGVAPSPLELDADRCAEDEQCWRDALRDAPARLVATATVEVDERDYTVAIRLVEAATGRTVVDSADVCEVCSVDEAARMVERHAAIVAQRAAELGSQLAELVVLTEPSGASVTIDQQPHGPSPVVVDMDAGHHVVHVERPRYLPRSVELDLRPGTRETVRLPLSPSPPPPQPAAPTRPAPRRGLLVGGAIATGLGGAAVVLGAVGLAVHDRPYGARCSGTDVDAEGDCRFLLDTRSAGAVTLAIGSAALVGGVTMLVLHATRDRRDR